MKSEVLRVTHELQAMKDKIKENSEKIKVNKTLPYLVSNVIEVSVVPFWNNVRNDTLLGAQLLILRGAFTNWRQGVSGWSRGLSVVNRCELGPVTSSFCFSICKMETVSRY